jgi:hypothetical protein
MIFMSIPRREITIRFATMGCGELDAVGVAWDAVGEPTTTGTLEVAKPGYEAKGVTTCSVATELGAADADAEAARGQPT